MAMHNSLQDAWKARFSVAIMKQHYQLVTYTIVIYSNSNGRKPYVGLPPLLSKWARYGIGQGQPSHTIPPEACQRRKVGRAPHEWCPRCHLPSPACSLTVPNFRRFFLSPVQSLCSPAPTLVTHSNHTQASNMPVDKIYLLWHFWGDLASLSLR